MADEKGSDDKIGLAEAIKDIIKPDRSKIILAVVLFLAYVFLIYQLFQFQDAFMSKDINDINTMIKSLPDEGRSADIQPIDVDKANETAFQIKIFFWTAFFLFGVPTIYLLSAVILYAARILAKK